MSQPSPTNKFRRYLTSLTRSKVVLVCCACDFRGIPCKIRDHLHSRHVADVDSCPWCLGQYSWPKLTKKLHWEHLTACYNLYRDRYCISDRRYIGLQKTFWTRTVPERNVRFACPRCEKILSPKETEEHYAKFHGVDVKTYCVWCDGRYEGKDANHLMQCFEELFSSIPLLEETLPLDPCLTSDSQKLSLKVYKKSLQQENRNLSLKLNKSCEENRVLHSKLDRMSDDLYSIVNQKDEEIRKSYEEIRVLHSKLDLMSDDLYSIVNQKDEEIRKRDEEIRKRDEEINRLQGN